jgi:hypothetical protein
MGQWPLLRRTRPYQLLISVLSIPLLLICMSNFSLAHAAINTSFKSLSIFAIAIAVCRLALQYNTDATRINYPSLTFWLAIQANVAVIMASISSYRVVVLDYLKDHRAQQQHRSMAPRALYAGTLVPGARKDVAKIATPHSATELRPLSEQRSTRSSSSFPIS